MACSLTVLGMASSELSFPNQNDDDTVADKKKFAFRFRFRLNGYKKR